MIDSLKHRARSLLQSLILITVLVLAGVLMPSLPAQAATDRTAFPLSERHPDAGVWVMYRGANTVDDLKKPHIQGVMAYAIWNMIYVGPSTFDWSSLDKELDFIINQAGKRAMIDIPAGYCPHLDWPQWMRRVVASHTEDNGMGCYPLQFWDPVYIELHKEYIRALATHLAQFDANDARPDERDIVFVRAEVMAETMENLPNEDQLDKWTWEKFTPARNGNIYQVDLTSSIMYEYQAAITLAFQEELARAYGDVGLIPPVATAKGGNYWRPYPTRDLFVDEGVWFTQHSASPNPQGWYYDIYIKARNGETRATTETGGRSPDDLLGQYAYWEVLAALHFGVEFIGIYGTNRFSPDLQPKGAVTFLENQDAMRFAEKYAGQYRNPATSPGAWVALRGGYPEDRFGKNIYLRRMWTNYDFLMRQIKPQMSVMLYGQDHKTYARDSLTPVTTRPEHRAWRADMDGCLAKFSTEICDYLWQHPNLYIGEANNQHQYTYPPTDLGEVVYCGERIFCTDREDATRVESMIWARRTNAQGKGEGGSASLRFDLNDEFAQSLNGRVRVRVVYLDKGRDRWALRYDAKDDAEKVAYVLQKEDTNLWKEVYIELDDARFENRQTEGADLTLYSMDDGDDTFHMIEVVRLEPPASQADQSSSNPAPDEEAADTPLTVPSPHERAAVEQKEEFTEEEESPEDEDSAGKD